MTNRLSQRLTFAFAFVFFPAGCVSTRNAHDLKVLGLEYQFQELNDPRPNRVHVLRVDLANRRIKPAVVIAADPDGDGPAEAALTNPLRLARDQSVLAFVNANPWESIPDVDGHRNRSWFEGQPVDIFGLAASGGHLRSHARPDRPSVWIDDQGKLSIVVGSTTSSVVEATGGFHEIVRDRTISVRPGGEVHPRTAIGVDRTQNVMWLVVVDGRQAQYSEGMSLYELGRLMRDLGCWHAANMDGGGSSIMGLKGDDGLLRVVNSPSDRHSGVPKIRPLPMILTIEQISGSNLTPRHERQHSRDE